MTCITDKVFLLSRRWTHHSGHSGYDLLANYIGNPLTIKSFPDFMLPDKLFTRIARGMIGYDRTDLALELLAARHMATRKGCLYHILYGENCYNRLGALNGWRNHRIIASYHHPPQKFAVWIHNTEPLKLLSAVIVVGKNQIPLFEAVLPHERIFFVPHPVDTSFFKPPMDFSQREENLCLFVGVHLRDFGTLRAVIQDAKFLAPQLKFVIVTHPDRVSEFDGVAGNFIIRTAVPEPELLKLYQTATVFIQPLHDATANNAILEAMASGMPMVVTNIGAVGDYANEDCAYFVPPYQSSAMLDAILELVNNPVRRKLIASKAREQALRFDWRIISQQMREVYEQVMHGL